MTTRKPDGVSFEDHVEAQIRAAMERGEFANLPGTGKPIADLDDDDPMWWLKRKLKEEGVSMPLPPHLQLRADVRTRIDAILALKTEREVRSAMGELNARIATFNAHHVDGPPSELSPVDVEAVVDRWKARWG
jgi:hypothetical protein